MDRLVPTVELPNGKKIYTIQNQTFEVPREYQLTKLVGCGSYGIVCAAVEVDTGDRVAIKRVSRVLEDLREGRRVLRELEIMTALRHTNLIRLRRFLRPELRETFTDVYTVMDLYDTDLDRIIRSRQALTEEHHQYFIIQAFRGLYYLHSARIMHRDLKPSNLLVNADCALAICDFGLARDDQSGEAPVPELTQYVVTRWYRAPEVLGMGAHQYTSAVDVWSLGLIFAELLVGSPLLPGPNYIDQLNMIVMLLGTPTVAEMEYLSEAARGFILAQPPRPRRPFTEIFPAASPAAADLLGRLLAFHPAQRPTAAEVIRHPYFSKFRDPAEETEAPQPFEWRHAGVDTADALREEFWKIIEAHQ